MNREHALLATLAKCSKVHIVESEAQVPQKGVGISNIGNNKIFLNLGPHINVESELQRLNKKLNEKRKFIEDLDKKINDKNRGKIPQALREKQDKQMEGLQSE